MKLSFAQAANYLNIKSLLDLGCLTVANMIKGESVCHTAQRNCADNVLTIRSVPFSPFNLTLSHAAFACRIPADMQACSRCIACRHGSSGNFYCLPKWCWAVCFVQAKLRRRSGRPSTSRYAPENVIHALLPIFLLIISLAFPA